MLIRFSQKLATVDSGTHVNSYTIVVHVSSHDIFIGLHDAEILFKILPAGN